MGTAHSPYPVKVVASLLTGRLAALEGAKEALVQHLGPIDWESELLQFDHTDYYTAEMGTGLVRQIVTLAELVTPAALPAIKVQTNDIERALAEEGKRVVNIDPGYLSLAKLVLASTKDHAHRVYLDRGIYAEVTLSYQSGRFRPWAWTYPDYASDRYCSLFGEIRQRYKRQIAG